MAHGSRLTAHGSRLTAHGSRLTAHGSRPDSVFTEHLPQSSRKNLLIGAITNYSWDDVAPFFNSYVRAGFENCDCVMFTGNMSEHTLSKMRSCGVQTLPIPKTFSDACVNDFRWELYKNYLIGRADDYGLIFTADVRDTIFQADVFKAYEHDEAFMGIALEDGILTESVNKSWLIHRYGQEVWTSMNNERIICTGTVWGTAHEFLAFTSAMAEHIASKEYPYFRVCDQAVGNWLIYHEGMFADVIRPSTNYDGPVITVGLTDLKDIHTDSAGNILNGKGEIAAVVHQYDRKLSLVRIIVRKYGAGMSFKRKLKLRHPRAARFWNKAKKKGLAVALAEAIRRRIIPSR